VPLSDQSVATTMETLRSYVDADGGGFSLLTLDRTTASVTIRLDFTDAACLDCVLPSAVLEDIAKQQFEADAEEPVRLTLIDPRVDPTTQ
jgi:Fe-S cluster biogenesis protein NfuA